MVCINGLPMVSKWIYQVCPIKHTLYIPNSFNEYTPLYNIQSNAIVESALSKLCTNAHNLGLEQMDIWNRQSPYTIR